MTLNIEKIIAESVNAFNSSDKKYFVRFMNEKRQKSMIIRCFLLRIFILLRQRISMRK